MANSYSDDIKVKISEKYKPPCRISMPMSYSQRLMLNKQLQDTRPSYDFHLEKSVLEKMKEWKVIRRDLAEEKKQRLDLARQEFNKKIEKEKAEKLEKEQAEAKLLEETNKVNVEETKTQNVYNHTHLTRQQGYPATTNPSHHYYTKNGILMPISATNYSTNTNNILKPIPTTSASFMPPQAFNLSDFESDTSSPFDNMELKSINDLEELAQVLKSDRTAQNFPAYPNTTLYQGSGNYNSESKSYGNLPTNIKSYTDYSQGNSAAYGQNPRNTMVTQQQPYSQITNSYSQISSSYNPTYSQYNNPYISASTFQVPTNYTPNVNGYLYSIPPQMTSQIQLSHSNNPYDPYNMQKSNCKSVPDLVKSLEKELDSTRLNDTVETSRHSISSSYYTTTDVPVPARPKSTDTLYPKTKLKDVSDPLEKLSGDQKNICTNVSMMGFPLDRVVRVCGAIGCDQKKIVDHLLALADLLDLGFSEKDASEALMKSDNDRDKALDLLIS